MSGTDKIKNATEKVAGTGKEAVGKVSDNPELEAEGKADHAKAVSSRPVRTSKTP
ncbi:CsbD family protein [Cryobacterium lactosi]|uniref:CsbD family protein n=1 Tax=Cryobacterium lactosi TaxID=1259202 RepID=UPI0030BA0FF2